MKRFYHALIKAIAFFENVVCYTGLIACSFLVFIQVLNRYIFHFEIMWIGDLSLYFYVFFMILTISLTARAGSHTSVDVFVDIMFKDKEKGLKIYKIFVGLVVLAILIYMLPMSQKMFARAMKYPEFGTLVRWFNTSWLRELVLITITLSIIHTIHNIGVQITNLYRDKRRRVEG